MFGTTLMEELSRVIHCCGPYTSASHSHGRTTCHHSHAVKLVVVGPLVLCNEGKHSHFTLGKPTAQVGLPPTSKLASLKPGKLQPLIHK